jgi:predicted metal-dependent phosphoesterase TrpH
MSSETHGRKADLHLHTHYSDGTESPFEVVARAAKLHLNVVAVTDHDTLEGVAEAMEAGRNFGVEVVPGVEITAQFHQQELHLLAYFSSEEREGEGWLDSQLEKELEKYAQFRRDRAEAIVKRLNALGISITMEDVRQQAVSNLNIEEESNSGTLGRPHVAAALVAGKHVSSIDEAFNEFLKKGRPAWVDKERVEAGDIIGIVQKAGGIVALAHPGLLRDGNVPSKLVSEGIDGVEVYHSRHTNAQSLRFRSLAEEKGLLITGGSDCHGMLKGEPLMGRVQFCGDDLDRFLARLET